MNFSSRVLFEIAAGAASLISLFGWAGQELFDFAPNTIKYLVVTVIGLFFVYSFVFLFFTHKEYAKINKTKDDHLLSHKITHNLRNALSTLRDIEFETNQKLDKAKDEPHIEAIREGDELKVFKAFKTFGAKLADAVQKQVKNDLIRRNIDENIRVTVKFIEPYGNNQEEWSVSTLFMDPKTWADSDHTDTDDSCKVKGKIKDNTDFSKILIDKEKIFYSNNLSSLGDEKYLNSSSNWRTRYNSTLVVPIKNKPQNGATVVYYGFLTVDSLNSSNKEIFSEDEKDNIFHIMAHASDSIASWFIRHDVHVEVLEIKSGMQEGNLFLAEYITKKTLEEAPL